MRRQIAWWNMEVDIMGAGGIRALIKRDGRGFRASVWIPGPGEFLDWDERKGRHCATAELARKDAERMIHEAWQEVYRGVVEMMRVYGIEVPE